MNHTKDNEEFANHFGAKLFDEMKKRELDPVQAVCGLTIALLNFFRMMNFSQQDVNASLDDMKELYKNNDSTT